MSKELVTKKAARNSPKRKKTTQIAKSIDQLSQPLPEAESAKEKLLEGIKERIWMHVFEIGDALMQNKTEALCPAQHMTFDEYCIAKWGFGPAYSYRHIDSAKVHNGVEDLSTFGDTLLPQNEAQIHHLAKRNSEGRHV